MLSVAIIADMFTFEATDEVERPPDDPVSREMASMGFTLMGQVRREVTLEPMWAAIGDHFLLGAFFGEHWLEAFAIGRSESATRSLAYAFYSQTERTVALVEADGVTESCTFYSVFASGTHVLTLPVGGDEGSESRAVGSLVFRRVRAVRDRLEAHKVTIRDVATKEAARPLALVSAVELTAALTHLLAHVRAGLVRLDNAAEMVASWACALGVVWLMSGSGLMAVPDLGPRTTFLAALLGAGLAAWGVAQSRILVAPSVAMGALALGLLSDGSTWSAAWALTALAVSFFVWLLLPVVKMIVLRIVPEALCGPLFSLSASPVVLPGRV